MESGKGSWPPCAEKKTAVNFLINFEGETKAKQCKGQEAREAGTQRNPIRRRA